MRFVLFASLFILSAPLVHAQWVRYGLENAYRGVSLQIQNAIFRQAYAQHLLEQNALNAASSLPAEFEKSIFTIQEKDPFLRQQMKTPTGSAFLLETTYKGQKELWGVSAGHYTFKQPIMNYGDQQAALVSFEATGAFGMTDITLFRIPPSVAHHLSPLKLADTPPNKGEVLSSVGYFENKFHTEKNRFVKVINPQRIITTLRVDEATNRMGACGSPLLNQRGEVVGVHIGSSYSKQEGFAVPLGRIQKMIEAYHDGNRTPEPLLFNGKRIGHIYINQYIFNIILYKDQRIIQNIPTYHHESEMDYSHLEKWTKNTDADMIILEIHEYPISKHQKDQSFHFITLTYHIDSGEIVLLRDHERQDKVE